MGVLTSKLFTEGDKAVADKLENCANGRPSEVLSHFSKRDNRVGEHVRRVQEALKKVQQREPQLGIPGFDVDGVYDDAFARAVFAYKDKRGIRNFANRIDDVIGINTIRRLDSDARDSPEPKPPTPRQIADVVVRFQGARVEGPLTPDSVLIRRLVVIYQPAPNQPFGDKVLQQPFSKRLLVRLGRRTTTIGEASRGVLASIGFEIAAMLTALKADPGKIYIHGSSSGGRNAIDFAARLTTLNLKPHLVAAVDAAFFQENTPTRPEAAVDKPVTIPEFIQSAGSAPLRHNFFQTLGNHAKSTLRQGIMFTSSMAGEEIHGRVQGFENVPLNRFLPRPLELTDDEAHEECGRIGGAEAQRLIADDLLLKTP
jgi:hypothetical protein